MEPAQQTPSAKPRAAPGTAPLHDDERPATHPLVAPSSAEPGRDLASAALRDVGRVRQANQDSVFALLTCVPRESTDLPLGIFVVADGMGGHEGGEVASRLAVRTVVQHILANLLIPALDEQFADALQSLISDAVEEANLAIYTQAVATGSDMGTTCTAALLLGHSLFFAHVGDSRLYLRTPNALIQLTDDHSAVGRLIQLGQLDLADAREHPMRSQLYRTVGQQPRVAVDVGYRALGNATQLLLCSDGLWSMIDDPTISALLAQSQWPQQACRTLVVAANEAGGEDNIGVVVVTLPGPDAL